MFLNKQIQQFKDQMKLSVKNMKNQTLVTLVVAIISVIAPCLSF
jgi:hypothetical protein